MEPDAQTLGLASASLVRMMGLLVGLALLPFLLSMVSAFAKLVIVGGILRQGLGMQQVPPTVVITGLALILTIHIMSPVAEEAYRRYQALEAEDGPPGYEAISRAVREPLSDFLAQHTQESNRTFLLSLRPAADAGAAPLALSAEVEGWRELLTVSAPAFLLTELTDAFRIGFLILLPFLIIDLVVGNVLLALGMMMMSPQMISLPLKLLLFLSLDGWREIMGGLAASYQ